MNSSALTLGRAKGAVFLGQALTFTVLLQREVGEGASSLCLEADVFYGDTRQDAGRVSVSGAVLPQTPSVTVTVSSAAPVDEPVVTVYLRAGCESKTSRRFVILAEPAGTVVLPTVGISSVPPVTVSPQLPDKRSKAVSGTVKRTNGPAVDVNPTLQTAAPASLVSKSSQVEGPRARLKLIPLDLAPERDPTLKLTDAMTVGGGEDLENRAQAAVLWRSLNATPQEIQNTENRRLILESDLKGLQAITTKNSQLLDDMTLRLGEAESRRYTTPLVYGLLVAAVLCGLTVVVMWSWAARSGKSGGPWWRDEGVGDMPETVAPVSVKLFARKTEVPPVTQQSLNAKTADFDHAVDAAASSRPQPEKVEAPKDPAYAVANLPATRGAGHMDFGHSMSATLLRSVNSKEMLDVRQQAEFFMTLGQHEEAIVLLQESVEAGPDANPLVFLELLKVLHTLGRKVEYDHYRIAFNAIFNGHVPVYAEFSRPGSGLEAYPVVCSRIVALWPSEEAMAYIENCLVRGRKESGVQDFNLEAFRDLLMLHGVASRMGSTSFDSGFMAFKAAKTAPVLGSIKPDPGVDLDLSEPYDGNLIDFDTSGWSPSASAGV